MNTNFNNIVLLTVMYKISKRKVHWINLIKGTVERQSPFEDLINLVSHNFKQSKNT